MSKTFRRTKKGQKRDWLPGINFPCYLEEPKVNWNNKYSVNHWKLWKARVDWVKKNPHRSKDIGDHSLSRYSKSPSHWNHQYSTIPRRAKERELLSKIKKGEYDPDDCVWPDGKKPVIYYW